MKPFLQELMASYGAEVQDSDGVMTVVLPEEGEGGLLAKQLGRRELRLVFEPGEALADGAELVAPGCHVLRVVEEFLAPRGGRTYLVKPGSERLTKKALVAFGLRAAKGLDIALDDRRQESGYILYVVYRLRYRSLQRIDVLETVRVRLRPNQPTLVDLVEQPPTDLGGWELRARKQAPRELIDPALSLADGAVTVRAQEEGQRRRKDARRRFTKDASRLHAYYAAQIAEYQRKRQSDLTPIRIEELEEELELRLRELAQASEVTVEVEPVQLLTIEEPLSLASLVLRTRGEPKQEAPRLAILFERATGELSIPPCASCDGALIEGRLSSCGAGHVVHEHCIGACATCATALCGACSQGPCEVCSVQLCPSCGKECPGCGRGTCASHFGACSVCEASGCAGCLRECAECGKQACARDVVARDLCKGCAESCPGCQSAVVRGELRKCKTCGRKFCPTCHPESAAACSLCGQ